VPPRVFVKGVLILNAYLVPLAFISLYTVYRGSVSGDRGLLAAGMVAALAAPLLAYVLARATLERAGSP